MQAVLEGYFQAWNDGFSSKSVNEIKQYMSKDFIGYWAHGNLEKSDVYDYN